MSNSRKRCRLDDCDNWFDPDEGEDYCYIHRLTESGEGWPLPYNTNSALCIKGLHIVHKLTKYCKSCNICEICSNPLSPAEYEWCIRQGERNSDGTKQSFLDNLTFVHPSCFKESELLTMSTDSVTLPRRLFDKLNACRLLIEPKSDLSVKANEYEAECFLNTTKWFHELSFDDKYKMGKRLESIAAACSMILKPHRREIDDSLAKQEQEKFKDAKKQREQSSKTFADRVAERTEKRVEREVLTAEEKKIRSYMKSMGLKRDEAIEMIAELEARATARKGTGTGTL